MEAKHTPLPWKQNVLMVVAPNAGYSMYGGRVVGHLGTSSDGIAASVCEANAEFICRAVNSHYDLLAACKAFANAMRCKDKPDLLLLIEALHLADAAIAKAEAQS